jgi:hypothetical protein
MDKKMSELICIKTFASRSDAEVSKSVLSAHHIASFIQADDAGGMYPFMTEKIRLFIKKNDENKAKTTLHVV